MTDEPRAWSREWLERHTGKLPDDTGLDGEVDRIVQDRRRSNESVRRADAHADLQARPDDGKVSSILGTVRRSHGSIRLGKKEVTSGHLFVLKERKREEDWIVMHEDVDPMKHIDTLVHFKGGYFVSTAIAYILKFNMHAAGFVCPDGVHRYFFFYDAKQFWSLFRLVEHTDG